MFAPLTHGVHDESWVKPLGDELCADIVTVARIHREHAHGCPARGSQPDDERVPKREMVSPAFSAGAEKRNDHPAVRIDSRNVRPLVRVAMDAGQGEILWVVSSQVLPCDDVFDVVRSFGVQLRMEAIIATIARPPAYKLATGCVHQFPG